VDLDEMAVRLPEQGFHRLYRRQEDDDYRCRPRVSRDIKLVIPSLRKLFRELARKKKPWPLYLYGAAGHGKTAAALTFCDHVAGARYWCLDDLMGMIAYSPWLLPWEYYGVELAVLDEVGAVRTGKGRDLDYEILKRFWEWRQDRPTIYIGNQPLTQIRELYDARIFSRLSSGTQYQLVDRDRRLRKHAE